MAVEQQPTPQAISPPARRTRAEKLAMVRKVWPWVFLVFMIVLFTVAARVMNGTNFLSQRALQGILLYSTQILLLALGETMIIIAAGIDLSVGYILGLSAVVAAEIMKYLHAQGYSPWLVVPVGMLGGVLVCIIPGYINGWLVAKIKVPPFISTLGMGYAVFGAALLISGGYPVAQQPPYLGQIGNGSIFYLWLSKGFGFFKTPAEAKGPELQNVIPLLPNVVFITILVTIVCWYILSKTQFGQHLYAIGGNFQAAVRAGIRVQRTIILVYVMGAVLAGIAGALWAARFTSGAADAGEAGQLMAIAAVVIGGASLFGGEGNIIGTVVGALLIATIQFGLVVLGMQPFWQFLAVGLVVILAVIVDQFGRTLE